MKLFCFLDTGGSGHGTVGRQFLENLLDENVELSLSTHEWGFNRRGFTVGEENRQFPDYRLREKLLRGGVNEDYLLEDQRELRERNQNLYEQPKSMEEAESHELMIKDFDGKEDAWLTVGGLNHAQFAPQDDDIYTICETDWNLDIVPRDWKDYAEMVDEVWCPNEWNYRAFERRFDDELMKKVKIMPYGVDFSLKPTKELAVQRLTSDKFTFLSVGRWCHMKGMDVLVKAFLEEFRASEPVRLFIKTTLNYQRPLTGEMVTNTIRQIVREMRIPDPPEIGTMTSPLEEQQYIDLFGASDAFVLPSTECVGISIVQAAGYGLPIITTKWSAQPEYLDENEAFWVDFSLERPNIRDNRFHFYPSEYPPDSKWAVPDQESLQEQMRRVYEGETRDATSVREKFDWDECMNKRMERLREIAG